MIPIATLADCARAVRADPGACGRCSEGTMKLDTPADLARELRELAGMAYPLTTEPEWARAVAIVERAASEIEAAETERQRPTKANPDAPGNEP